MSSLTSIVCNQDPYTTIDSSNAYGILIVIFPFPLNAYQGLVNPKSQRLSPGRGSAVARNMLNSARRTERLTGGDDRVDFCALSRCWVVNAVWGVVWRGRSQAQWRMRGRCWLGRVGESGLNVEFQEAELSWVM